MENNNLEIKGYNPDKHYKFMRELCTDKIFSDRGFYHIEDQLKSSKTISQLLINTSYIVEKSEIPIAFFTIGDMNWAGTVNLEYGIHSDYRGQNKAKNLLDFLTETILNDLEDATEIRGYISTNNLASQKVAEKVGYINQGRNGNNYSYIYKLTDDIKRTR